ncbi:GNAT family N-acetyltransferase [Tabrizicola sp. TH137]|uniref:GNAT family N-acetyltransferase n=1 Tax=Tabrizicola sp. TH137 TaxID=2067452 RepID=UPI000C7D47D9|nr:GNAT family N-acetyltransferase [Tabrizicola sp. TH137]PLL14444.1 GNAT family N-acetyltransferase [Tabrizicola sp. TH137]
MTGGPWADVRIRSTRFDLRPITETDVTPRYLGWFASRGASNITQHPASLDDLRTYVRDRSDRTDILFLAIRSADTGQHIGNLKLEPIDRALSGAILGIFIGEEAWHGKGVATETIGATAQWLQAELGLRHLWLGVTEDNHAARRAYEKSGFVLAPCPLIPARPGILTMALDLVPQKRA